MTAPSETIAPAEPRRILVTGGAKGVGAAIVRTLAAGGYAVDFTYRSSGDAATALARELADAHGVAVNARALDLSDTAAIEAFCAAHEETSYYGLVHNAGQSYDALTAVMSQDKAEAAMQVNFWSVTRLVKTFIRPMIRARSGRIAVIGSVTALQANAGNAAYAASKGALLSYLRTLAIESAKRGVTANYIAPGFIDTDMMTPYAAYRPQMEKQIPAGRFAAPDEIAGLVAFLMSPPAAYITGAVIPIDGGLTAQLGVHR
ncbi:SDR family oxidoreductase [Chelatococcus asaccharovorans]|uniref:SDR family oxidoreductase n=1 Tax=Chelatococcus asaccharovorans TaxID=28210 RepID=UPI00224C73BC|nr:SDR family oxidoreductase [Chelatococcus asaccharovorans]CAH1657582.1 3-oxoacyl-(acyl-carrier protein) reductase [Chelatococcus asaccharovorans]CAH1684751.1 3-oxoacyl-(acyl-carrier protein) reductase [Chelatococcus asaccharovorans]